MIRCIDHALTVMAVRGISTEWVERVAAAPAWTEADPTQTTAVRAFGRIAESDNRVLRVVYDGSADDRRIITVFFDRRAQRPS